MGLPPGALPPGSVIGILGGGQLGRMTALAAARLGYRCHVYGPEDGAPGMQVAEAHTVASFEDTAALGCFARAVDVVTFEFENVPAATLDALEGLTPCRPGLLALSICQDRLREKHFLQEAGVPVAPWLPVTSRAELEAAVRVLGLPAVLKTTRMGYDGRGQAVLRDPTDLGAAWERLSPRPLVLESFVPFAAELSAIAARSADGRVETFETVENRHRQHILEFSFAPGRVPGHVATLARAHAVRVAEALDLVGVVALELFLLPNGTLLGNEIAPRPHNSGHWTIDACAISQFEQHVRAVVGLPLGDPSRHADAVMRNLIGAEGLARWPAMTAAPGVAAHHYGKSEARPGRKLGHATLLLPLGDLLNADESALLSRL